MNRERRKTLAELTTRVDSAIEDLTALKGEIEDVRDEEQEYLDNMPESLQEGDRAMAAQAAIDSLEEAIDAIEEATDAGVVGMLETAAE